MSRVKKAELSVTFTSQVERCPYQLGADSEARRDQLAEYRLNGGNSSALLSQENHAQRAAYRDAEHSGADPGCSVIKDSLSTAMCVGIRDNFRFADSQVP